MSHIVFNPVNFGWVDFQKSNNEKPKAVNEVLKSLNKSRM